MSTRVATLLTELASRGITLQADGDRLRFHPQSAVGPDILERLKTLKPELIAAIREPEKSGIPEGWTRERWAARLEQMAGKCVVPARAAELLRWRAKILSEAASKRV